MSIAGILRRGIAETVRLGPFVDDGDGHTPETGLTLSQADIRLSKNGAAAAQKNESTSCSHDENGYYRCPLNTTDISDFGYLEIAVNESGALPVKQTYLVLPSRFPNAIFDTTIASYTSQTSWTLTDGPPDNHAFRNMYAVIFDATTGLQIGGANRVTSYVASTKTISTVDSGIFTFAAGDIVVFFSELAIKPASTSSAQALGLSSQIADANILRVNSSAIPTPAQTGVLITDTKYLTGTLQTARDLGASVLVGDKTGFSLSSGGVQAVWDALTSALTTSGSIGKLLTDRIDATIASRLATSGYRDPGALFLTGSVDDSTPSATAFTVDSSFNGSTDLYTGSVLVFTSGTLQGIARKIQGYTPGSKTMSFADKPFPVSPADEDTFTILGYIET